MGFSRKDMLQQRLVPSSVTMFVKFEFIYILHTVQIIVNNRFYFYNRIPQLSVEVTRIVYIIYIISKFKFNEHC